MTIFDTPDKNEVEREAETRLLDQLKRSHKHPSPDKIEPTPHNLTPLEKAEYERTPLKHRLIYLRALQDRKDRKEM